MLCCKWQPDQFLIRKPINQKVSRYSSFAFLQVQFFSYSEVHGFDVLHTVKLMGFKMFPLRNFKEEAPKECVANQPLNKMQNLVCWFVSHKNSRTQWVRILNQNLRYQGLIT